MDIDNFEWEYYISIYDDLSNLNTKELAYDHYINHGIHEKRLINIDDNFDWKFYLEMYPELKLNGIDTRIKAYKHYIDHGIIENRFINNKLNTYYNFDWKFYLDMYPELRFNGIDTEKKAYKHYIEYGIKENRHINNDIFDIYYNFDYKFYIELFNLDNSKYSKNKAYNHWIKNRTVYKKNNDNILLQTRINELGIYLNCENSKKFITFIIPTIGRESLMTSVRSLINQTDTDWNAIIIFDGVKNNYDINDKRIRIIEIEKNGKIINNKSNAGLVRNIGFKYVENSEWVGFLDDDDTLSNDYIDCLKKEIYLSNNIDVCIFRMKNINNIIPTNNDITITKCKFGIGFVIKKNISDNILFKNDNYEDYYYLKELEYKGYNMVISPYVCYFIRQLPDNNINDIENRFTRIYIDNI